MDSDGSSESGKAEALSEDEHSEITENISIDASSMAQHEEGDNYLGTEDLIAMQASKLLKMQIKKNITSALFKDNMEYTHSDVNQMSPPRMPIRNYSEFVGLVTNGLTNDRIVEQDQKHKSSPKK